MQAISVAQAQKDFLSIVDRILKDLEPTLVMTEAGDSIVMLSLEEFNSWKETMYLLSTPANAEHLLRSIAEDQSGYAVERVLDEE